MQLQKVKVSFRCNCFAHELKCTVMCNCSKCENRIDDENVQSSGSNFSEDDDVEMGYNVGDSDYKIFWQFSESTFLEKIRVPFDTIEGALGFHEFGACSNFALEFQFPVQNPDCLLCLTSCSFCNILR